MSYKGPPQDVVLRQMIGGVEVEVTLRIQLINCRIRRREVIEVKDSQEAAEAETQPAVIASRADASCADRSVRRRSM